MPRRAATLGIAPVLAAIGDASATDEVTTRVLDAAAELLEAYGFGRWSVDDVAVRSGLGRTTVYRRFESRDHIVHAVLARECRRFFTSIAAAVADERRLEDKIVAGMLVGLDAFRSSVTGRMLGSDEAVVLPLLTTDAALILTAARTAIVEQFKVMFPDAATEPAAIAADALIRLSMSLAITPSPLIPLDDRVAAAAALHVLVDPLVRGFA